MDFNVLTPITVGFFTAFIMGPVFWVLLETSITKGFKAARQMNLGKTTTSILEMELVTVKEKMYFSSLTIYSDLHKQVLRCLLYLVECHQR